MAASEGRAAGGGATVSVNRAHFQESLQDFERVLQEVRHLRERLQEIAGGVATTESGVADTYHRLADQAMRQGRLDDARRLEGEATAAARYAEHEMREVRAAAQWLAKFADAERAWAKVGQRIAEGRSTREQAARERQQAAALRERAARQREEIAGTRDERALIRAVAAGWWAAARAEREESDERRRRRAAESASLGAATQKE